MTQAKPNKEIPSGSGLWLGLLFCVPFLGLGLFCLFRFHEAWSTHQPLKEESWAMAGVGILFTLVGVFMLLSLLKGEVKQRAEYALRCQYPQKPWMHREDWSKGQAKCQSESAVYTSWFIALVWNGISAAPVIAIPEELDKGNEAILISLIFPLVGLFILYGAIRSTLRFCRFGNTIFRFCGETGVLGGRVEGRVWGDTNLPVDSVSELTLQCVHRKVVGSGKNRRVSRSVLYEQKYNVPTTQGNLKGGIPVSFQVPFEAKPTDNRDPDDQILWELSLKTELKGADFEACFEIPVFKTADSNPDLSTEKVSGSPSAAKEFVPQFPISPGVFYAAEVGEEQIQFRAARNLGQCIGLFVTCVVCALISWVLYVDAPVLFSVFFGLATVLVFIATLRVWTHSKRVVMKPTGIRVTNRYLGIPFHQVIRGDAVLSIESQMVARSQADPRYVAVVRRKGGGDFIVTEPVRDKREAEWFAQKLRDALRDALHSAG